MPEGHVPDTVYVLEDDSEGYVGIVKLRHRLNDALRQGAGHIGYGIRKDNPASLKVQLRNGARVDHESGEEYFTRIPLSRQP